MRILHLAEDNIAHIVQSLDVVSFIFLMSTCKQFFNMRNRNKWFVWDIEQYYYDYDIRPYIPMLLNSYISLECMRQKKDQIISKLPYKTDLQKIKNTMTMMAYYQLLNRALFMNYTYDDTLLEMCCKGVCQRYKYKYTRPHDSLYRLFWAIGNSWHNACINIVDMCEIAYHVRFRKYRNLYNTLQNIEFRLVYSNHIFETIQFLLDYVEYEINGKHKTIIVCLMYMYMQNDIQSLVDSPQYTEKYQSIVIDKADEFVRDIELMSYFPKYLRYFMIDTILNCVNQLSAF